MDQFKCGKLWWKLSAVKISFDASKQLIFKFSVPIKNKTFFQEDQEKKLQIPFNSFEFDYSN